MVADGTAKTQRIRLPTQPPSDRMVDGAVDRVLARIVAAVAQHPGGGSPDARFEEVVRDELEVPDCLPPATDLLVAPDGRVWLRGMDRLEPEPVDWWVVDPEEGIAARLSRPVDFDGVLVRGSNLWGVRTGELDVERVVQLRVRRPD